MKLTLNEYKKQLKGLPKEEKLLLIKQELANRGLEKMSAPGGSPLKNPGQVAPVEHTPTDEELEFLQKEIGDNVEAYESETLRKELIPFMYDRTLDWYFNAKNIKAQEKLVMPIYSHFEEGPGKQLFDPLDFLNLLVKQKEDLLKNLDKPFGVISHLKLIPLSERERHALYGFLLKWFGGYPVNNMDQQVNTILKLIEKEFLTYPDHTPEKEICHTELGLQRRFAELGAHLSASMPGVKVITPNEQKVQSPYDFPESRYIDKVPFDFGDLPHYIIQKGIIWKFESKRLQKETDYSEWLNELISFLQTIPAEYQLPTLVKGVEYGKKVYRYHLNNECTQPDRCELNQSWERRLALAESLLKKLVPSNETEVIQEVNSSFVLNEQVLSKIDFLRLINVLYELRAFKRENGQIPDKKEVVEAFGKLVGKDVKNFHPDLNKAYEKSEEANTKFFEILRSKAEVLWNQRNP